MKTIIQLIIISSIFSSCISTMSVNVEVADRELVKGAALKELNPNIKSGIDNIDEFIMNKETLKNDISKFYVEDAIKKGLEPGEDKDYKFVEKAVADKFELRYGNTYNEIISLNQKLKDEYGRQDLVVAYNTIAQIDVKINQITGDLLLYNLKDDKKINAILQKEIFQSPFYKKLVNDTKSIEVESERMRFHLLGDPMTSFISKKSNSGMWKDNIYNKTFSRNIFGNSDIAVILRTNPPKNETKSGDYNNNFTIKGVRLDADDTINATFNVMSQAIGMVSTVYGAPKFSTSNSTTDPIAEIPDHIVKLEDTEDDYQISEKKFKDYKKLLITFIKNEDVKRKSGEDLKNSITRIKNQWNTIKAELNK